METRAWLVTSKEFGGAMWWPSIGRVMVVWVVNLERLKLWDLSPPPLGVAKFNVDVAARDKLGLAGIGGALCDSVGTSSIVFSKSMGLRDSNEAKILGIRRTLSLWVYNSEGKLIIEGDSANTIKWTRGSKCPCWKLVSIVRVTKALCSVKRFPLRLENVTNPQDMCKPPYPHTLGKTTGTGPLWKWKLNSWPPTVRGGFLAITPTPLGYIKTIFWIMYTYNFTFNCMQLSELRTLTSLESTNRLLSKSKWN